MAETFPIPVLTEDDQTLALRMAVELRRSSGFQERPILGNPAIQAQYESIRHEPDEAYRREMRIGLQAVQYAHLPATMDFVLQVRALDDPELLRVLGNEDALRQLLLDRTSHRTPCLPQIEYDSLPARELR